MREGVNEPQREVQKNNGEKITKKKMARRKLRKWKKNQVLEFFYLYLGEIFASGHKTSSQFSRQESGSKGGMEE